MERLLSNSAFRESPQLASFLRFVVEMSLQGRGDRIKGYTIATEALGRATSFDPQSDPIVRVEASRLRRILDQYFSGDGKDDPIIIELPRGNYIPNFRFRREELAPANVSSGTTGNSPWRVFQPTAKKVLVVTVALFMAVAADIYMDWRLMESTPDFVPIVSSLDRTSSIIPISPQFGPVVSIERVKGADAASEIGKSLASLHLRISDAFSRFDELQVVPEMAADTPGSDRTASAKPMPQRRGQYRLASEVRPGPNGSPRLTLRLFDVEDSAVVWSRQFEEIAENEIIVETSVALAQPHGLIYSRELEKILNGAERDPRYVCLLRSFESWPSYSEIKESYVRNCLEKMTANYKAFANGFAALSIIYFREYLYGYGAKPGAKPALDRALEAAQEAVRLRPQSARAHQALMDVYYFRGNLDESRQQGEMAVALNPYDMYLVGSFGSRLIFMGDSESGMALLRKHMEYRKYRGNRTNFAVFLAEYLKGNYSTALMHANEFTNDRFALGVLARALANCKVGNNDRAREYYRTLVGLNHNWHDNPRGELKKFFPNDMIVDRLAARLGDIAATAAN